jgi:hypothetical protein
VFARTQDDPVYGVFVESKQPGSRPYANAFGRVVDDLPDRLGRQMDSEQRTGSGSGEPLAAGSAPQQIAALVLAVFAAYADIAMPAQAVILALFVWTEALLKVSHGLPPHFEYEMHWGKPTTIKSQCQRMGTAPKIGKHKLKIRQR